jgi:hypothetical protein
VQALQQGRCRAGARRRCAGAAASAVLSDHPRTQEIGLIMYSERACTVVGRGAALLIT